MKLEDVILRDDRASQPAATTVPVGTIYCVTDEGDIQERSNGTVWESFSPTGTGSGDVSGPVSSTDKAIARWNGTGGDTLQDSTPIVENDGRIATVTDPTGLQDAATKAYVDTQIAAVNVGGATQTSFLVSGGQVVWDSAYTFLVSAATYYINGVLYSSAADSVTLAAADPSDDRIDVIAVDDSGAVVVVPGTAAAQPSEPDIDPGTQLKLSIVLVSAGTSAPPAATSTLLYADNAGSPTEWNWTASAGSIDVNSTNDPRSGTKSIEGTAVVAGVYAQGQIGTGTFDPNSVGLLVIYVRSKAAWANKRGLQVTLRLAGVLQGVAVNIERNGTWGFNSATTGVYQQVAIPTSQFAIPQGTLIDQVRIADFGGSIGFYLDDLSFQGGATAQPVNGITQEQADARYRRLSVPLVLSSSADVSGDLPLANLAQASAASRLLGRGSASGAGDFQEVTLGSGLALTGTVLDTTGSGPLAEVIGCTFDGAGSALTAGAVRYVRVPFDHTITANTMLADVSGSAVVDVWRDSYANYPPVVGDSITASAKPTLSGAISSTDSTLTGWSVTGNAGDVYAFKLDSTSTITVLVCELTVTRT